MFPEHEFNHAIKTTLAIFVLVIAAICLGAINADPARLSNLIGNLF